GLSVRVSSQAELGQLRQQMVENHESRIRAAQEYMSVVINLPNPGTELLPHTTLVRTLQQELETTRAEATSERQRWQQERAAEQGTFQQERAALEKEEERVRRHAVTQGQERDETTATRQQDADRWPAQVHHLRQERPDT